MDINTELPVLVYGTLRPTGGNYENYLEGFTDAEQTVRLPGFTMYGTSGFPFMTQGDGKVTFTMVTIAEGFYKEVMDDLDRLEGFRAPGSRSNLYDRILHTFTTEDGTEVQAWVYVTSPNMVGRLIATTPVIESGDWIQHVAEQKAAALAEEATWLNY